MSMKQYPSTVSRTLDPRDRGLATIVGRHDRRLTDADVNLLQDLQDLKRSRVLENTSFSGVLSMAPFKFDTVVPNTFFIPSFDVLFNGEVVRIAGNKSQDLSQNVVRIPAPKSWIPGSTSGSGSVPDARIYTVYLEIWYKSLEPETNNGYALDANGRPCFFWGGNVDCDPSNVIPADEVDPFQGLHTTSRTQIQWAIRVAELPLSYNFDIYPTGLDVTTSGYVLGRGAIATSADLTYSDLKFKFRTLGSVNGDYGLWYAGEEFSSPITANELGTMDGRTYAMPLALVFQRNTSAFALDTNPYGCADLLIPFSGLTASGISGRYDQKFADAIYEDDVVDTRQSTSLVGYESENLLGNGFTTMAMGALNLKPARGESPGSKPTALGSKLQYFLSVAPAPMNNAEPIGTFDGFMNGFSGDDRTFYTTRTFSVADKKSGVVGQPWAQGDVITLDLSDAPVNATIVFTLVQSITSNTQSAFVLYGNIAAVETSDRLVKVTIGDLSQTPYTLGTNPICITIGVLYAGGSNSTGFDLKKVPYRLDGGKIVDTVATTFPVYAVSEYETVRAIPAPTGKNAFCFNPNYSNLLFGTRVQMSIPVSSASVQTTGGINNYTFVIPRDGILGNLRGLYVISAVDKTTGSPLQITKWQIIEHPTGSRMSFMVSGNLAAAGLIDVVILCENTSQLSYISAVKGVTAIEEVVKIGYNGTPAHTLDPRVQVPQTRQGQPIGIQQHINNITTIQMFADHCTIKGVSGDDSQWLIWIKDGANAFTAVPCSISIFGGILSIQINDTDDIRAYNFVTQPWFMVASILPAFTKQSSMVLAQTYIPYQGEGIAGREYSIIYADKFATVTTNGTGAAPVVGIKDVYPFNRNLPLVTALPALETWRDSDLANIPISGEFSGNYYAKRYKNVEHTFEVALHTNDFIEPVHGWKHRKLKLAAKTSRGFKHVYPHTGFAIKKLQPQNLLGDNLQSTIAPIILYVNNVNGSDSYDGSTKASAKKSVAAAISLLPPVIRHPVSIVLINSGTPYAIKDMGVAQLQTALLGDGETRSAKTYALGHLAFTMQDQGRVTIGREGNTMTSRVEVNGGGFDGFPDGSMSAFLVYDSRVIFNGIKFTGFVSHAYSAYGIKAIDADVEFYDCEFSGNLLGVSAERSSITINRGLMVLDDGSTGVELQGSSLLVSGPTLEVVQGQKPQAFFVGDYNSSIQLTKHDALKTPTLESHIGAGVNIIWLRSGASATCDTSFITNGSAKLQSNSVLTRGAVQSFRGGVDLDESSHETIA
jgi:hypothetical protein